MDRSARGGGLKRGMKFQTFINRPEELRNEIKTLEAQLEVLEAGPTVSSAPLTGMPKAQGPLSRVEENVILIDEKRRLIEKRIREEEEARAELAYLFSQLQDSRYIEVLHRRYLGNMSFSAIAHETHRSEQHVYRLHKAGLEAAEKIYRKS